MPESTPLSTLSINGPPPLTNYKTLDEDDDDDEEPPVEEGGGGGGGRGGTREKEGQEERPQVVNMETILSRPHVGGRKRD
ncbi:hypothetical protein Pmani_012575 [Petrolisthes manimaculis]|uniref:Uncharacterized protein n=1 Tax=Petrolisthes manimaculis TaxID=1843537 RepID=A0AAE1PYS7_9EUCA|nr:hypothetical protein Pmani_012575 [Petrolisthes manimaculis]